MAPFNEGATIKQYFESHLEVVHTRSREPCYPSGPRHNQRSVKLYPRSQSSCLLEALILGCQVEDVLINHRKTRFFVHIFLDFCHREWRISSWQGSFLMFYTTASSKPGSSDQGVEVAILSQDSRMWNSGVPIRCQTRPRFVPGHEWCSV